MIDISHLVTFVAGTAVGAAGQYMADRFTDQRRTGEAKKESDRKYKSLVKNMPALIAEMKEDISKEGNELIREFVVLPNE